MSPCKQSLFHWQYSCRLDFVPTGEAAFDLVVPKIHFDHPNLQAMLQRIRSRAFQREVETLAAYNAVGAGARVG